MSSRDYSKRSFESDKGPSNFNKKPRDDRDYYGPGDGRPSESNKKPKEDRNYYGPAGEQWGREDEEKESNPEEPAEPKIKPNFGLSGALAKDEATGNAVNGVVLKFNIPFDTAMPDHNWRLYVFKGDEIVETLHIHRKNSYLFGRDDRVADVMVAHPSCSKQHAVIHYRRIEKKDKYGDVFEKIIPYLMDLGSVHKTFLNGAEIDDSRYYELRDKDCLKFGGSTREYVLMREDSKEDGH